MTNPALTSSYVKDFVEQVRSYDTWDWTLTDNKKAKHLNSLMYIVGPNRFMEQQVQKIASSFENPELLEFDLNESETLLIEIDEKSEQNYIKRRLDKLAERTWTLNGTPYQVGIVFGEQYISVLGNELHKANPHLDFVAVIDPHGGKVSLRTIHKTIHVGDIAKAIHPKGGGHAAAAGFEYEYGESLDAMQKVMGVVPSEPVFISEKPRSGVNLSRLFRR